MRIMMGLRVESAVIWSTGQKCGHIKIPHKTVMPITNVLIH
jgi:hypothetical protein